MHVICCRLEIIWHMHYLRYKATGNYFLKKVQKRGMHPLEGICFHTFTVGDIFMLVNVGTTCVIRLPKTSYIVFSLFPIREENKAYSMIQRKNSKPFFALR